MPYGWPMTHDEDDDPKPLDDADAARQVAEVTGMSKEAAETFAAFHQGRYAPRPAFDDAA